MQNAGGELEKLGLSGPLFGLNLKDPLGAKNNYYQVEYDSISFGVRQYAKSIRQGSCKGELNCIFEPVTSQLNYDDQTAADKTIMTGKEDEYLQHCKWENLIDE